jgi:Uma2 family endonuclease
MHQAALVPVEEYLTTAYRPDCEYLEGQLLERKLCERDHSEIQVALAKMLDQRHRSVYAYTEQRVQVKPDKFRVPDLCVVTGAKPVAQVFLTPPFLCVEILSRDDRMSEMQDRLNDYLQMGVPYVWLVDPQRRRAYYCTEDGLQEAKDGFLRTTTPELTVSLGDSWSNL